MKNNDKDIIEVYAKRVFNELKIKKNKKLAELEKTDKYANLVEEYNKKVNEFLEADGRKSEIGDFDIAYCPTDLNLKEKVEEIEKEYKDAMDDRDRVIEEVRAVLKVTDFDDVMDVLKRYGIVQENGLIYDYRTKTEDTDIPQKDTNN